VDRSQQQPQQHSPALLAPQPNRIIAEPATVQSCRSDYEQGADVRRVMDQQIGTPRQ
jgi:hypothetical protein